MNELWKQLESSKHNRGVVAVDDVTTSENAHVEITRKNDEEIPRRMVWHSKWFILFTIVACLAGGLIYFYRPYMITRGLILELEQKGYVNTKSDLPDWLSKWNNSQLEKYFPVIEDIQITDAKLSTRLLKLISSQRKFTYLGFHKCKIEDPELLVKLALLDNLRSISLISCDGADYSLVDKMKSINPKLHIYFRGKICMGVSIKSITGSPVLVYIEPDLPASKAGLKSGDVIISFNGEPTENFEKLIEQISRASLDVPTEIQYERDGQVCKSKVTLIPWPEDYYP